MKICFIINQLKKGGAAKMIKYVSNIAADIFEEVSIIDIYDEEYNTNDLNKKIILKTLGLGKVNRFYRQFLFIPILRKELKKQNANYICAFIGHVCTMSRLAIIGINKTTFISCERADPYSEPFLWQIITKWTYRNSDYCIFQLEKARDYFGKQVIRKSYVIPNPVIVNNNIEPYSGKRNKTIVSAGRFSPEKCHDILIEAFAIVHKIYPEFKLIIYGDGILRHVYEKQIERLNIQNNVLMPGYVKCVAETIRKEGIFVLSSRFEGIPNSLIEAMSIGIPCISTDCTPGGPSLLMKNGERGILVPVGDVNKLASAIISLIDNQQLTNQLSKNSIEIVHEFSEPKIREMWIEAFNKIILKS